MNNVSQIIEGLERDRMYISEGSVKFKLNKSDFHDINGNGRAFWIGVTTKNGEKKMLSLTKSNLKNYTSRSDSVEFEVDIEKMDIKPENIKSITGGEFTII